MIKLQIIGNLGRDCVVNNVNGKSVINFAVAHTEKFKNAQGVQQDKTIWVDCAYWTDRVAIAPYLKKGTMVFAEGQPDIRSYTTKEGTPGTSLTLRVQTVQLLGGRQENGNGGDQTQQSYNNGQQSQPQSASMAGAVQEPLDDLPF
jgi:single-strand DNA-binding protein